MTDLFLWPSFEPEDYRRNMDILSDFMVRVSPPGVWVTRLDPHREPEAHAKNMRTLQSWMYDIGEIDVPFLWTAFEEGYYRTNVRAIQDWAALVT